MNTVPRNVPDLHKVKFKTLLNPNNKKDLNNTPQKEKRKKMCD